MPPESTSFVATRHSSPADRSDRCLGTVLYTRVEPLAAGEIDHFDELIHFAALLVEQNRCSLDRSAISVLDPLLLQPVRSQPLARAGKEMRS